MCNPIVVVVVVVVMVVVVMVVVLYFPEILELERPQTTKTTVSVTQSSRPMFPHFCSYFINVLFSSGG